MENLPICVAKTQYSFSDDQTLLGAPKGFTLTVRNLKVSAGAGFIVALTGDIMTMPGLPKRPAAEKIDVDSIRKDHRACSKIPGPQGEQEVSCFIRRRSCREIRRSGGGQRRRCPVAGALLRSG